MPDQADILRHLVAGALRSAAPAGADSPPLIAIAGGKGGVGATTLAVNTAVALAGAGLRVVLADVDFCRADVALHCGLTPRSTIADVLSGRREIHETLVAGPAGIQVAPGAWASPTALETRPAAQQRLLDQLRRLRSHVDIVLLDVGCDAGEAAQQYWQAADRVLLVTTADSVAIMDAYAAVKVLGTTCASPRIQLIINQLPAGEDARHWHRRIDHSAQRFLGFGVPLAGAVPRDGNVPAALRKRLPIATHSPNSPAAAAVEEIAAALSDAFVRRGASLASA